MKYLLMIIMLFAGVMSMIVGIDTLQKKSFNMLLDRADIFFQIMSVEDYFLLTIYFTPLVIYLFTSRDKIT
ncbi:MULTISPECIES: hypothetical protein [unclassified Cytobacillus]|uniref:hypothetical protein n=1 Tax=unclassified Cytobacillus TaxID=2675268 RepID=UPI00135B4CE9|nr:hypothetical protein [Cytobacillus sp. AMY 15.2]KAF0816269.1 hypothetical protein KIS4809_4912 [Bacillus sp. ZZV12-4809]MCM3093786.1 hypothetical protein [Cytobacillus sp. AMY 15.2]